MRAALLSSLLLLSSVARAEAGADPFTSPTGGLPGSVAPASEAKPAARDEPLEDSALATGPLTAGAVDGDLGLIRRTAPRTEASVALRPGAIIDTPGFYGMIGAGLDVGGSYKLNDHAELFGTLTVLQFRFVQNATLTQSQMALGNGSAGLSWRVYQSESVALAPFARLHLPTSFEFRNAWPVGVEPGLSASGPLPGGATWHAGASLPVTAAFSAGGSRTELQASAVAGGSWRATNWFALTVEAGSRLWLATTAPVDLVDQLTAGVGLRFKVKQVGIELNGIVPVAGATRWDGAGSLRAAYGF
ncbi:MAG: hypothetical protein ACK4N5_08995 [Myxococcales bacterium]